MSSLIDSLIVIVLVLNLAMLGTSRILTIVRIAALQGALLGTMPPLLHGHPSIGSLLIAGLTILLKGGLIPWMLTAALREAQIKREVEPLVGLMPSMVLGALATGFALVFASRLPLAEGHASPLLVPAALATMLAGFLLLTTRFKAISQVIGYLILENGIFMFGLLLVEAMPLVVELGVLLDLVVGIFVICIIVNHINRAFSSLDTRRLVALKE